MFQKFYGEDKNGSQNFFYWCSTWKCPATMQSTLCYLLHHGKDSETHVWYFNLNFYFTIHLSNFLKSFIELPDEFSFVMRKCFVWKRWRLVTSTKDSSWLYLSLTRTNRPEKLLFALFEQKFYANFLLLSLFTFVMNIKHWTLNVNWQFHIYFCHDGIFPSSLVRWS